MTEVDTWNGTRRLKACVEQWPDCMEGAYDPHCCRFPKSCSCLVYNPANVSETDLEDGPAPSWLAKERQPSPVDARADVLAEAVIGAKVWAVLGESARDSIRADYRPLLSRLDEVHPSSGPGMTVNGDVLHDLVTDAVPRLLSDDAAKNIARDVLDGAVKAGMTVLHGPELRKREVTS